MSFGSLRGSAPVVGAALVVAILIGCGSSNGVPVAKARGTITYKGKPVAKAAVSFIPETPGTVPALATTDENGSYTLSTYGNGDGAPVGRCRVAISLTGPSPPLPEHLAKAEAAAETLRMPGKPLIPKKYFSPETSRLTADVVAKTDNVFDFPLDGDLTP
ncbi:Uncharacterized protein OS=Blastopirellula marina DSM 3645 GN=DSM3645_23456 PE=4 SV=1 [Gemmata massiliana]|uniref:Carboxypeptidase regulatory-like domain-containing protein n=1 Tax=Gemmata massiliana TaxID=1210884 RepID=A0A6P2CX75_9BACT|nr:carboxypeptidase-like regulatory domain-containing protein [Gemmata massiliana]VTR92986.1 Uncharacterized protein OS=Blastopirellula marina DSM 3645 GN=DSM3645_23456 PE=4 SV=1 [Gemmata massiliana]